MTRYLTRDRAALAVALVTPLAAAAILLPFRASWPNTNVALLLLVAGVAVSQLAAYARRLKVVAITDAGYLAQIHQAASLTQTAKSPGDVVDHVRQQLAGLLDLQECRFEYGVLLGHPPRLEPDGTMTAGRGRWVVETAGLPGPEIELRVFGNRQYYGRFMMRATLGSRPSLQARLVAVTLAEQAGRALAAGAPASSTG
jgi:hypothetical protein